MVTDARFARHEAVDNSKLLSTSSQEIVVCLDAATHSRTYSVQV